MKVTRVKIRNLIMKEIQSMGEDVLVPKAMSNTQGTPPLNPASPCEQCGSDMYEGECMECGYMESPEILEGSGCGCGTSNCSCSSHKKDSMLKIGDFSNLDDTNITPGEAFGLAHELSDGSDEKHHNNYMAKPALYKVAKYSQKLLEMIPDGYELDDWQRSKIAQISDDISEVYHSLDYDMGK